MVKKKTLVGFELFLEPQIWYFKTRFVKHKIGCF